MSSEPSGKNLQFEKPATYRIRVTGHIDDSLSGNLGGMIITRAFTADSRPLTILVGHLSDQAALSGVLNELYEMHLPLLTVESLSVGASHNPVS
ncbi:MAG: hypothetical protein R6W95_06420 [Desulfosarcina sp.]